MDDEIKELKAQIEELKTRIAKLQNDQLRAQHGGNGWSSPHLIPVDYFGEFHPIK
jgi:hypothetical protein